MTTPIGVYLPPGAQTSAALDPVLATLPLSYARGSTARGNVAVVEGSPDWPTAAARAFVAGAIATIVVHPSLADLGPLDGRPGLIALDARWASSPAVDAAARTFAHALPRAGRLECQVRMSTGSQLDSALVDQLSLIRALVGAVTDLRILTWSVHGYAAEGTAEGHPVDLALVCTDALPETASVRLLTTDGAVDLLVPSGLTAAPARLSVTGPDGVLLAPTIYESGHRATWRRVRTLLSTHSAATDLDDFASDSAAARTAVQLVEG